MLQRKLRLDTGITSAGSTGGIDPKYVENYRNNKFKAQLPVKTADDFDFAKELNAMRTKPATIDTDAQKKATDIPGFNHANVEAYSMALESAYGKEGSVTLEFIDDEGQAALGGRIQHAADDEDRVPIYKQAQGGIVITKPDGKIEADRSKEVDRTNMKDDVSYRAAAKGDEKADYIRMTVTDADGQKHKIELGIDQLLDMEGGKFAPLLNIDGSHNPKLATEFLQAYFGVKKEN